MRFPGFSSALRPHRFRFARRDPWSIQFGTAPIALRLDPGEVGLRQFLRATFVAGRWRWLTFLALLIATVSTRGEWVAPGTSPAVSVSGQFVVYGASIPLPPWAPARLSADTNLVTLEAPLLAVSCERIKQKLRGLLGAQAPYVGKIYVYLRPANSPDDPVNIACESSASGWNYRLSVPDIVPRERFVRAIVDVLLLEMANRSTGTHGAELPRWVGEGLSAEVLAEADRELLLSPPNQTVHGLSINPQLVSGRLVNPLEPAKQRFLVRPPLTFQQLSWPESDTWSGDRCEDYRRSAQLFVRSLLALPDGKQCFNSFLSALPGYYNWQLAFLKTWRGHFPSALAVEKWWALQVVQFVGVDLNQLWSVEVSWRKLDEIVRSPIDVRTGRGELPLHSEVPLQTIIREWDPSRQRTVLQRKITELDALRVRVAPSLAPLVDDYRVTLRDYLIKLGNRGPLLVFGRRLGYEPNQAPEEATRRLDALEQRRRAMRPQPAPLASSP